MEKISFALVAALVFCATAATMQVVLLALPVECGPWQFLECVYDPSCPYTGRKIEARDCESGQDFWTETRSPGCCH